MSTVTLQLERPRVSSRAATGGFDGSWLPYSLAVVFVLLLYASPALLVPELDAVRPTQWVGVGAGVALLLDRTLSRRKFWLPSPQGHAMVAFVGIAVLSSVWALWVRHALISSLDLLRFAAVYFVIVNAVDRGDRLRGMMLAMVFGGLFPALGALKGVFLGPGPEVTFAATHGRAGWVGIFENPNDLAYALVLLVPLTIALGSRGRSRLFRLAGWLVAAVFVAGILVTYSRSGLVGLVVVLGVMAWRARRPSWRVLFVVAIVAALLFTSGMWARQAGFTDLANDLTVRQRIATVEAGLSMWADRPLLGIGFGCSVVGWPLYAPAGITTEHWLHNHNTFVQLAAETGTLGLLAFLTLLGSSFWYLRNARRVARRRDDEDHVGLCNALEASLWGLVVLGMAGGYLLSWFPYLLFALAADARRTADSPPGDGPPAAEARGVERPAQDEPPADPARGGEKSPRDGSPADVRGPGRSRADAGPTGRPGGGEAP